MGQCGRAGDDDRYAPERGLRVATYSLTRQCPPVPINTRQYPLTSITYPLSIRSLRMALLVRSVSVARIGFIVVHSASACSPLNINR